MFLSDWHPRLQNFFVLLWLYFRKVLGMSAHIVPDSEFSVGYPPSVDIMHHCTRHKPQDAIERVQVQSGENRSAGIVVGEGSEADSERCADDLLIGLPGAGASGPAEKIADHD